MPFYWGGAMTKGDIFTRVSPFFVPENECFGMPLRETIASKDARKCFTSFENMNQGLL